MILILRVHQQNLKVMLMIGLQLIGKIHPKQLMAH